MKNGIVGLVMVATVSIILVATLVMPVLGDMEEDAYPTYSNDVQIYAEEIGDEDVSIVYSTSGLTVDGVAVTKYIGSPIIASDTLFVDCVSGYCTIMASVSGSGTIINQIAGFTATIDASEKSIALSSITYTESASSTSTTSLTADDYSWGYHIATSGDYTALRTSSTATDYYVNEVSQVRGGIYASGSLYTINGTTVTKNGTATDTATVSIDTAEVSDVEDVLSMSLTNSASTSDIILSYGVSSTASINLLILPKEVTGVDEGLVDSYNLIIVLPVLLIIAILLVVVRGALVNRD